MLACVAGRRGWSRVSPVLVLYISFALLLSCYGFVCTSPSTGCGTSVPERAFPLTHAFTKGCRGDPRTGLRLHGKVEGMDDARVIVDAETVELDEGFPTPLSIKERLAFPDLESQSEGRLFSNLEPCDITGFKRKPSNLLAATALVGGTTVGAGILGLPAVTIQAGFGPSTLVLVGIWVYMVFSGLLIAEVNVNLICRLGTPGLGLLKLAEKSIGPSGARIAGLLYVFIHYALLVAYIAQGGEILEEGILAVGGGGALLPPYAGEMLFTTLFGGLLAFGSEGFVEQSNNLFVAGVIVSFVALLTVGAGQVHVPFLFQQDWGAVSLAVPTMFVALVFHNIVPTITTQLEGNVKKVRFAIVVGSLVPLLMFIAWNCIILGSVDLSARDAALSAATAAVVGDGGAAVARVFDPLEVLRSGGAGGEGSGTVSLLVSVFSELAIITSFYGFVVGLQDFYGDVFNIAPGDDTKTRSLCLLILGPPFVVAAVNPSIFFAALDNAGTFGISLLFGVLPAVMAWRQRYDDDEVLATLPLVPGGKFTLAAMIGIAGIVIAEKLVVMASTAGLL